MPAKTGTKGTNKGKVRRSGNGSKSKNVSANKKAGTIFPVGRLNTMIRRGRYSARVGASAGAFMAAVLEYVTAEVLELSGDLCHQAKNKIIQPRHLNLGLRQDDELSKLLAEATITSSSVQHHVHDFLLPHKGKKAAAKDE